MLRARIYFLFPMAFIFSMLYSVHAVAKGMEDLSPNLKPSTEETQSSKEKDKTKSSKKSSKEDQTSPKKKDAVVKNDSKPPKKMKPIPAWLKKLHLRTSFGFVYNSKDSLDWGASGASDIEALYHLMSIMDHPLFVTFRYYPFDIAPHFDGDSNDAYYGVISSYLLGSELQYVFKPKLTFTASSELALMFTDTYNMLLVTTDDPDSSVDFMLVLGGGADYQFMDNVSAGSRVRIGFGTMTNIQFSGNLTFAF